MAKAFATLIDNVQSLLGDNTTVFTDAIVTVRLDDSIREASDYLPYERKVSFFIESRTGTATTDTASALVDATEDQFLSTDVDKVIHNTQNNTWAIVTAYVDVDQLTLSKDIMADGDEDYEIFNKGCHTKFQINIEDVTDWIGPAKHGVIAVEYPIGTERNFTIDGDILTIKVDSVDDSKVTDPATDTEVLVWFETIQRVSQLTDLLGAIDNAAGYAVGSTTIHVDSFAAAETIAEDTLFTIVGVRGTYRVTADATLSSSEIDIIIHPALLDAATEDDVITVIGSTLNTELERLVVQLAAAQTGLAVTKNAVTTGGPQTVKDYRDDLAIVLGKLDRLRNRQAPRTIQTFPKD